MWQFIVISTSILALIYGYTGWRIIGPSRFGPIATTILWLFIAICAVTPALVLTARSQRIESWWSELLGWLGFLSMGLFLFAFVFVLARDLLLIIGVGGPKLFEIARSAFGGAEATAGFDAERRAFLVQATNAGIVALSGGMTGYGVYSARRAPPVKRVSIALKNLPAAFDGFRIAQITDIHAGPTIKRPFVEAVSDTVRELGADMIALTGDIVDGSVARLADDVAPLGGIDAPCGRYFVTGNHEYYSGADAWVKHVRKDLGYVPLMNEHRVIERNGASLVVAGVTDYSQHRRNGAHRSDPEAALRGAPNGTPRILLAHQPMSIFSAADAGVDLQISGHTHGGQFFPWNYVVYWFQPFVAGLDRHRDTQIYVSRGTGYWGPPLRVGSPSEITLITLVANSDAPDDVTG